MLSNVCRKKHASFFGGAVAVGKVEAWPGDKRLPHNSDYFRIQRASDVRCARKCQVPVFDAFCRLKQLCSSVHLVDSVLQGHGAFDRCSRVCRRQWRIGGRISSKGAHLSTVKPLSTPRSAAWKKSAGVLSVANSPRLIFS